MGKINGERDAIVGEIARLVLQELHGGRVELAVEDSVQIAGAVAEGQAWVRAAEQRIQRAAGRLGSEVSPMTAPPEPPLSSDDCRIGQDSQAEEYLVRAIEKANSVVDLFAKLDHEEAPVMRYRIETAKNLAEKHEYWEAMSHLRKTFSSADCVTW